MRLRAKLSVLAGIVAAGVAIAAVVVVARRARQDPARCAPGFEPSGYRCCPAGQKFDGACRGDPHCPPGFIAAHAEIEGCVMPNVHIRYPGGELDLGASDWEADPSLRERRAKVTPFELDSVEVTRARWGECVRAGRCRAVPIEEPGLPVSNVSPDDAESFCKFVGGRLPSGDEWLLAAGGTKGRKFAWGQTGLVCRRSVFGLVDGPCAWGGTGPEIAGSRPDGRSPEGALDLSGNVAEWARESDGSFRARGGSFRSAVAGELKTGSEQSSDPAIHVGFRCAYDDKR